MKEPKTWELVFRVLEPIVLGAVSWFFLREAWGSDAAWGLLALGLLVRR